MEADENGLAVVDLAARERNDFRAVETENAYAEIAPPSRQRGIGAIEVRLGGEKHAIQVTDTVPLVCHRPDASSFAACGVAAGRA